MKFFNTPDVKTAVLIIPIKDYSNKVIGYIKGGISREAHVQRLNDLLISGIVSLVLGALAVALVLQYILSVVLKPVSGLVTASSIIASGDLTKDIEAASNDEMGKLTESFKVMQNHLLDFVRQVAGKSADVYKSVKQLYSVAEETTAQANENVEILNDMTSTVEKVSSSLEDIFSASSSADRHAREGAEGINKIEMQMNEIFNTSQKVSKVINDLKNKTSQIDQIGELITNIADQTNLLALNAAIEAARAGDQGRGFAVVAEDVRKLAEQSSSAAKNIKEIVVDIQAESQKAVERRAEGARQVEEGVKIVEEVKGRFESIIEEVHNLTERIHEVVAAAQQVTSGVQSVSAST
ncbi:MAG: methyl-accepting chemotaxis protein [Desulfotomaculum sp.]|nr:methyl-accepting chemotaxis protein [Desulfotomaculum sp.]